MLGSPMSRYSSRVLKTAPSQCVWGMKKKMSLAAGRLRLGGRLGRNSGVAANTRAQRPPPRNTAGPLPSKISAGKHLVHRSLAPTTVTRSWILHSNFFVFNFAFRFGQGDSDALLSFHSEARRRIPAYNAGILRQSLLTIASRSSSIFVRVELVPNCTAMPQCGVLVGDPGADLEDRIDSTGRRV